MAMCEPIAAEPIAAPSIVGRRPTPDADTRLIDALRRRDPDAAERLVHAYGDRVYRLALRITGNAADAEEVVQDVFWSVTRKIDTFRGLSAFGSWVYRITANAAYQKRRGRHPERHGGSWEDLAPTLDEHGRQVEPGLDWSPRLKDPAIQAELHEVLRAAIDEIPGCNRSAFLLHDVEGLSNLEVAETLEVPLAVVKSRVHRARLYLRKRLAAYGEAAPLAS